MDRDDECEVVGRDSFAIAAQLLLVCAKYYDRPQ